MNACLLCGAEKYRRPIANKESSARSSVNAQVPTSICGVNGGRNGQPTTRESRGPHRAKH